MEVNNKSVLIIIVISILLIWYVHKTKQDNERYKVIIDTYMSNSTNLNKKNKHVKFNNKVEVR